MTDEQRHASYLERNAVLDSLA